MVCHSAIERGVLKATGRAPDQITWPDYLKRPFGVIEEPLEDAGEEGTPGKTRYEEAGDEPIAEAFVRESAPGYGEQSFDSRESRLAMERDSTNMTMTMTMNMNTSRHPAPP